MSHSFGIPSPGIFHWDVFPATLCLHYASFMERQLIVCENDTRPTDPKEKIDHVCMQQRYNWEGIHVILFIFPGFAVKDQSYSDMAK